MLRECVERGRENHSKDKFGFQWSVVVFEPESHDEKEVLNHRFVQKSSFTTITKICAQKGIVRFISFH